MIGMTEAIHASFFDRPADQVARDLLGCTLARRLPDSSQVLRGRIVETEAYFGADDPASRAKNGRKIYNTPMFDGAGSIFIYNVHMYWMLNFSTLPVSAVLVRAVKPLNFEANTRGPGRLTRELEVDQTLTTRPVAPESGLWVEDGEPPERLGRSHRIGVTEDLEEPLRFFDLDSDWVSRHKNTKK